MNLFDLFAWLVVGAVTIFCIAITIYAVLHSILCPLGHKLLHLIQLSMDRREEVHHTMLDWYKQVRDEELSGKRRQGERFYDEMELIEWSRAIWLKTTRITTATGSTRGYCGNTS